MQLNMGETNYIFQFFFRAILSPPLIVLLAFRSIFGTCTEPKLIVSDLENLLHTKNVFVFTSERKK